MDYNIARNGQQLGTATEAQLRAGLSNGTYHATDLVWTEGMADWKTASDFFGLASPEPVAPAPAQAPFPAVRRPGPVAYEPPPAATGTSGLAIASLIFGICGLVCGFFAGLPAIVMGHIARSKIKHSNGTLGGGGMALAGLILGYFSIIVTVLALIGIMALPAFAKVAEKSMVAKSMNDTRQLVTACKIYASDHNGSYPPNLEQLFKDGILNDRKLLQVRTTSIASERRDESEDGYEYFGAKMTDSSPGQHILIMSRWEDSQGKRIVGRNDGTVKLEVPQE
jgi:hypothetical protein